MHYDQLTKDNQKWSKIYKKRENKWAYLEVLEVIILLKHLSQKTDYPLESKINKNQEYTNSTWYSHLVN